MRCIIVGGLNNRRLRMQRMEHLCDRVSPQSQKSSISLAYSKRQIYCEPTMILVQPLPPRPLRIHMSPPFAAAVAASAGELALASTLAITTASS
jgi:hypothetical protein